MSQLGIEKNLNTTMQLAEEKVTDTLKQFGFGILTKIDFSAKMKEKLGKEVQPTVILGACNPALAYEAYSQDKNMLLLVPCNITLEQTSMLKSLERPELIAMAKEADAVLEKAMQQL